MIDQTPAAKKSAFSMPQGCGLGLRQDLMTELEQHPVKEIDFLEAAPENWIEVGGRAGERFKRLLEDYPLVCHGLSLSLGGPAPLDKKFLRQLRTFLAEHQVGCYSEHLSYCSDQDGHLYDLMPIPFTRKAADYTAERISRVQNYLGRRIAVENTSAYLALGQEMSEPEFINLVIEKADCYMLLDVNNVYVNSVNFNFDPLDYLRQLPGWRIAYCHVAGHSRESSSLIVDTHGAEVIEPVWCLLQAAYKLFGAMPTVLERDFNFPPLDDLLGEMRTIAGYQALGAPPKEVPPKEVPNAYPGLLKNNLP